MMQLKTIAVLAMLALGLFATACDNTIRGVGRDAQEAGDAIEDTVD
jgi:predicted small secreted protein